METAAFRNFSVPFVDSALFQLLLLSLARQRYTPKTANVFNTEYDYIIVGGGTAGSVVASRLSEKPCASVLLLEAGKPPPLLSEVPAASRFIWFTEYDWRFVTVPQKYTGNLLFNRRLFWPAGKALGGSSIVNGMIYGRGNRRDYDAWAAEGADGWSYKDVFPYFLKLEDNRDPEYVANGYHSVGGPLSVHRPRYQAEMKDPIFKAAKSMGYKVVDANGARQTGFYDQQGMLRSGQRCSVAKAYLVPAENRTNLDILPNARVRKVVIKNRRAVGVEFDYEGQTHVVKARREVIVSAGTINTPQILMLSGIGPRKELERHRIPIVADLPVGENLQDHNGANLNFQLSPKIKPLLLKLVDPVNIARYIQNRTGPLGATEFCSAVAFLKAGVPNPKVDSPNFQLYFFEATIEIALQMGLTPEAFSQIYAPLEGIPGYFCMSHIMKPRSRGTVTLNSTDPYDMPLIDPNYYDDPRDMDDVVEGMKVCNRIGTSPEMQKVGSAPLSRPFPGCGNFTEDEEEYYRCIVRSAAVSMNHPVGTARMGNPNDPRTVVDPHLRVKHVKGLRVIDASVMPIVPIGNINAPTIMIAEKASDIIKSTIECHEHTDDEGDWGESDELKQYYYPFNRKENPPFDFDSTKQYDKTEDELWKRKGQRGGYWNHVIPPKNVNFRSKQKNNLFLKVTPWNKEIQNVSAWNPEIMSLSPDISMPNTSNIGNLTNLFPDMSRQQQMRSPNVAPQPQIVVDTLSSASGSEARPQPFFNTLSQAETSLSRQSSQEKTLHSAQQQSEKFQLETSLSNPKLDISSSPLWSQESREI